MPTNNTDYSYHTKAVELVLTNHIGSLSCRLTPLVIDSLRGRHTQASTHNNFMNKSNFKEPDMHLR